VPEYQPYRQLIVQAYRAVYRYDEQEDIVRVYCIVHTRRRLPTVEFLTHQQF
jgi:plasmid stabilization system protein ParE